MAKSPRSVTACAKAKRVCNARELHALFTDAGAELLPMHRRRWLSGKIQTLAHLGVTVFGRRRPWPAAVFLRRRTCEWREATISSPKREIARDPANGVATQPRPTKRDRLSGPVRLTTFYRWLPSPSRAPRRVELHVIKNRRQYRVGDDQLRQKTLMPAVLTFKRVAALIWVTRGTPPTAAPRLPVQSNRR